MKFNCLIVDDEPLACEIIESYLAKFDDFEIVGIAHNAIDAFQLIKNNSVDLLFLDIQMPKITGIEFLRTVQNLPEVVITTAYRNYAVESFELEVMDYLIKPIAFERFMSTINRFYSKRSQKNTTVSSQPVVDKSTYFYVKENKKMVKIEFSNIFYIESIKDYVKIHTKDFSVVTKMPISNLEEKLPSSDFLRVHRSYIIRLDKISSYTSYNLIVMKTEIPIGRSYKSSVVSVLGENGI